MNRYSKLYLDDVTECQGELFVVAKDNGLDVIDFINYYMRSVIRSYMDRGMAYYLTLLGKEVYEELEKRDSYNLKKVKKSKEKLYDSFMLEWIGSFYSLCQWYSGLTSKEIIELVPTEFVFKRYNTLHDMDITLTVKKVLEARGLNFYE